MTASVMIIVAGISARGNAGLLIWQVMLRGSGSAGASRESDTTFRVTGRIGQPAPAFTAIGVDGQPHTVTPGDGRAKAIIFYMGFR